MTRPLASLSLDLDNKWSYLKTHGDPDWAALPSYLNVVVPRFLEMLAARRLAITVFVVGQDAALDKNHAALASLTASGHEIGNHSFHHEPWLHLYSRDELEREFTQAEESIQLATGVRPVGFRGPGYSCSPDVLRILVERGYEYDASSFPTFLGPVARFYYFLTARLDARQKQERKVLFGRFRDGFGRLAPYLHRLERGTLVEIPVTTMPLFKLPIHVSYLLYLCGYSPWLARSYFRFAIMLCRATGLSPSLLLHPLDFLGCDDEPDLSFFPAMNLPSDRKLRLVGEILDEFSRRYQVVPMREHAASIRATLAAT